MKKNIGLHLIISLLILCSCSRFDTGTSAGSGIAIDIDSNLAGFNGVIGTDTLSVTDQKSFLDLSDSVRSGIIRSTPFWIGNWKGERSICYAEFNADSLDSLIARQNAKGYRLASFGFLVSKASGKSISAFSKGFQIGFCPKKSFPGSMASFTDTTQFVPLSTINISSDTSGNDTLPIRTSFITSTKVRIDSSTTRTTVKMTTSSIHFFKTGKDSTKKDTITTIRYMVGAPILKTAIADTNKIVYVNRVLQNSGDTTRILDSIKTIEDTSFYAIKNSTIHIIQGADTIHKIVSDTLSYTSVRSFLTYSQIITLRPQKSMKQIISTIDSMRTLATCSRLLTDDDESLLCINNIQIYTRFIGKKAVNSDSVPDTLMTYLDPKYLDFSIFERSQKLLNDSLLTSAAAGRLVVIGFDLKNFWKNIIDPATGAMKYRSIVKAEAKLPIDRITRIKLDTAIATFGLRYYLSNTLSYNIEDLKGFREVPVQDSATRVSVRMEQFLVKMLYEQKPLPELGYLYLWIPENNFTMVRWKKSPALTVKRIFAISR